MSILWLISVILTVLRATAFENELANQVRGDQYSLIIKDKRVFIFAGEFHYQRLPVPELWLDIFQKYKAHGLNAVSIYHFWSWHSPKEGVLDFATGAKDIQRLFDYAKKVGLYVLVRPGPYCNAETSAGGLAHWATSGDHGKHRQDDPAFQRAWEPYMREISRIVKRNEITNGGNVILYQLENEFKQSTYDFNHTRARYMRKLKQVVRDEGVQSPFFHNEAGMRVPASWSKDFGNPGDPESASSSAVNLYGLDRYPGGAFCDPNHRGKFGVERDYVEWFKKYSPTQPGFMPEFKAGWFQPWNGTFYDQCAAELDPSYADVFYKNNVAQRVTLLSLYMAYGGTSWGHSAAPVVYTSYDYAAPIAETREIRDKMRQTKLLALFTRVAGDLTKTELITHGAGVQLLDTASGNDTGVLNPDTKLYNFILRNPDTGSKFHFIQHTDTKGRSFRQSIINLNSSKGVFTAPLLLFPRQSKIMVTDFHLTPKVKLLFCTAEILTYGIFGGRPVLVLYSREADIGTLGFDLESPPTYETSGESSNFQDVTVATSSGAKVQLQVWVQPNGRTVVQYGPELQNLTVYLLDQPTAYNFFAPTITSRPDVQPNEQVFVIGPYLVRSAVVVGDEVLVVGDSKEKSPLEVFVGDPKVRLIRWNGKPIPTQISDHGSLIGSVPGSLDDIKLPALKEWKVADSLPELSSNYSDSRWVTANKTARAKGRRGKVEPVLHSSAYGFHSGIKLYRGHFVGTSATRATINLQGGNAFGASAWVNGQFLDSFAGSAAAGNTTMSLNFPKSALEENNNVLTVLIDYHGHDQDSVKPNGPQNPRGILGAQLSDNSNATLNFSSWRLQGNAGGETPLDKVRGPMNEGGLYGERLGWHLPGFDASSWPLSSPTDGISKAGVAWYITRFNLSVPANLDVPIGIELSAPPSTAARVQLFINGYQYGKHVPHIGPQTRFPLQPGIINMQGENTLALSLWAMNREGARLADVRLFHYGLYETGFNFSFDAAYLQPRWTADRLQYA